MAKELAISINISSKGAEKVIKNLADLETELKTLQDGLKTLDFGTPAFKEAVKNINILKSQIKDVDKATEGLETAQRIQAIGEAVSIAASSFQILTGIIGLFISDTEDLEEVQRFENLALGVLNTTLGINTLVYQSAELSAKGYTFQTAAAALATQVATTATKIWNAVLKSNPIGLVVGGVIALTGAIYALVQAFSETNKVEQETLNISRDLNAEQLRSATTLKESFVVLTDNVATRELELETIQNLKKTYPGFNAFVDKNNKLTKEGIEFLKTEIALEELRARRKLLTQKILDNEIAGQEAYNEALDFQNGLFGKTTTFLASLGNGFSQEIIRTNALIDATEDFIRTGTILNDKLEENTLEIEKLLVVQKPFQAELKKTEEAEKAAGKTTEDNTQKIDKQTLAIQRRIRILQALQDRLKSAQQGELTFTNDILDKQNEVLERQNELLERRREELGLTSNAVDDLVSLFFQTIPNEKDIANTSDALFDFFNVLRLGIKNQELTPGGLGFQQLLDFFAKVEPDAENLIKILTNIPEETKIAFIELFNSYEPRVKALNDVLTLQSKKLTDFLKGGQGELLKVLIEVEQEQSKLFENRVENGLTENEILEKGRELVAKRLGITQELLRIDVNALATKKQIEASDEKTNEKTKEQLEGRLTALNEERSRLQAIIDTILEGVVRNNKFVESINEAEKAYRKTEVQILKNKKAIESTFDPQALEKYFAEYGEGVEDVIKVLVLDTAAFLDKFGEEGTKAIIRGTIRGLKEQGNLTRQELEKTIDIFEKASVAIKIAFGGVLGDFSNIIGFLKNQLRQLPNELTPLQKGFMKINEVAQQILSALSDVSNRIQQVVQANTSLLLEQLAQDEALAIATIGDASARARELQAQEQKKFAEQRFQIEKKARIQELQFSLANALVDSAGAIINALATIPPPASLIYATLLAGVTGAQVQAIQNQLTFVQSKQFVGRRGGLITGQSHEGSDGGVPAMLEGGEFVVNREAVRRFGDTISDLNSATGGRRLAIDDSRLVQAISSQNSSSTPLKAYVLYNSIQDTQKLNKKITQLARL